MGFKYYVHAYLHWTTRTTWDYSGIAIILIPSCIALVSFGVAEIMSRL